MQTWGLNAQLCNKVSPDQHAIRSILCMVEILFPSQLLDRRLVYDEQDDPNKKRTASKKR